MKVKLSRQALTEALQKAKTATEKKSSVPALNNFLLSVDEEALTVKATDLENYLTLTLKAEVEKQGSIAVNSDKLFGIVRSLPAETVSLELKDDMLVIESGSSIFRLTTLSPEDFLEFPEPQGLSAEIPSVVLEKAIDKTEHALAKEGFRFALQGMYIHSKDNRINFVGADGHRLALYWTDASDLLFDLLISRKSLKVIKALLKDFVGSVAISKDASFAHFIGADWLLSARLLDDAYPDYQAVIPKDFAHQALFDREALLNSLKRLSTISDNASFPVKLSLSNNQALLEVSDPEYGDGRDHLEVVYNGSPLQIGFNFKYLLEALDSFDADKIWLKIVSPDDAVVIEAEDTSADPFLCVVMPMRL